jgi:hypothetical protein
MVVRFMLFIILDGGAGGGQLWCEDRGGGGAPGAGPRLGRLAWGVLNFSDLLSAGEQNYLGLLMSRISFWSVSFGPLTHAYLWAEIQSGYFFPLPLFSVSLHVYAGMVSWPDTAHIAHRRPHLISSCSLQNPPAPQPEQQARTVARLDQAPRRDTNC